VLQLLTRHEHARGCEGEGAMSEHPAELIQRVADRCASAVIDDRDIDSKVVLATSTPPPVPRSPAASRRASRWPRIWSRANFSCESICDSARMFSTIISRAGCAGSRRRSSRSIRRCIEGRAMAPMTIITMCAPPCAEPAITIFCASSRPRSCPCGQRASDRPACGVPSFATWAAAAFWLSAMAAGALSTTSSTPPTMPPKAFDRRAGMAGGDC
jgi:hypothetical protein